MVFEPRGAEIAWILSRVGLSDASLSHVSLGHVKQVVKKKAGRHVSGRTAVTFLNMCTKSSFMHVLI